MFEIKEPQVFFKSSENMEEIDHNSVQLVVTSPPYGKIKDYGVEEQIGFMDSFEDYFLRLKKVWEECHRVLEPQCRLVINIGDQYLRKIDHGRYRIVSIASQIIHDCLEIGFDFLGDLIWQKVSTTNTTGGCSLMGSIYYPRNGLLTFDYEHILIFKKFKGKGKVIDRKRKELSKIPLSEWKKWFTGHWKFPGVIQKEHIAMFPEELPYRIIRMFSFIGDTILDPFLGSGTTLKVAKSLFRNGIGYEVNSQFKNVIQAKINEGKIGYFKDYQYMVYRIYNYVLKKKEFDIDYENQKQKGILILKDKKNSKIIIDYLYLDLKDFNEYIIKKELESKFKENTLANYLNSKDKWKAFENYLIVLNSPLIKDEKFIEFINEHISSKKFSRTIQFITMDAIISNKMDFSLLNNKKIDTHCLQHIKGKSKDTLSFI
ncbi:MAG: DNA methyltransferase [Promethearchaeota archaeon]